MCALIAFVIIRYLPYLQHEREKKYSLIASHLFISLWPHSSFIYTALINFVFRRCRCYRFKASVVAAGIVESTPAMFAALCRNRIIKFSWRRRWSNEKIKTITCSNVFACMRRRSGGFGWYSDGCLVLVIIPINGYYRHSSSFLTSLFFFFVDNTWMTLFWLAPLTMR